MPETLSNKEICEILSGFSKKKENLIEALHKLQENHPKNYLSKDVLDECCEYFKLKKAEVYGIVSYYSMFSTTPRGKFHINLCKSPVCTSMGGNNIYNYFETKYNLSIGNLSEDGLFSLGRVECLGRCSKAPSMMINKKVYTNLTVEKIDQILNSLRNEK